MTGFGLIIYIKLVIKYWLFHNNNKVTFRVLPVHGSDKNDSYLWWSLMQNKTRTQ